jgi:muramoyltetrapeptide carboxypeptidase
VVDLLAGHVTTTIVGGSATGVLLGGNLAMLTAEVGTSFSRPAAGGIVVIEDVGEEPYRIDRMLTQLVRSGWFDGVAGVVAGAFTDCGDEVEVQTVLEQRLRPLGVPVVRGFDIGHTDSSATVPLGVEATLDAEAGSLVLSMPALV